MGAAKAERRARAYGPGRRRLPARSRLLAGRPNPRRVLEVRRHTNPPLGRGHGQEAASLTGREKLEQSPRVYSQRKGAVLRELRWFGRPLGRRHREGIARASGISRAANKPPRRWNGLLGSQFVGHFPR